MITNSQLLAPQPILRRKLLRRVLRASLLLAEAAIVWRLSVIGWWPLAFIVVVMIELWGSWRRLRTALIVEITPRLMAGFAFSWMITLYPRALTQAVIGLIYFGWRLWLERSKDTLSNHHLIVSLVSQALAFEAIFLAAAIWDVPKILLLGLVWLAAFAPSYHLLAKRQDRAAGLLATAWGLISAEIAFITLTWLVSYTIFDGYFIVPQPAIILTVLAYSFGSIYLAQRQGQLGRYRLAEYLGIGLVIILIVISGTTWRGSL